jgi:hypothetical protein
VTEFSSIWKLGYNFVNGALIGLIRVLMDEVKA